MNSFRAVKLALEYEVNRQEKILEEGKTIVQETRLWDEVQSCTLSMRTKEEAQDYRYFPEPDLLPFVIDEKWICSIQETIPELPLERKQRFVETFQLSDYDAGLLIEDKILADFFEECLKEVNLPKVFCNWIINDLLREVKEKKLDITSLKIKPDQLASLVIMIDKGTISNTIAKEVFSEMIDTGKEPKAIVEEKKLVQISDEGQISEILDKVIASNPNAIEDYKKGKKNALAFLMGQVMKESKGKANPKVVNELLKSKLEG